MNPPILLSDLGERRILQEIIPQYVSGAGDDCATLNPLEGYVVVTTDPVPPPAAKVIGGDDDLYWMGWLLVTINASDIAASGAIPQAFVAALEMPPTLTVDRLRRFLEGIQASCSANGLAYVGGNLREAKEVGGVGTAIGSSRRPPLTRGGARSGDKVIIIGEGGRFWADVERIHLGQSIDKIVSPVFSPVSQAKTMHMLHAEELIACAMDTSDGLAPTLTELATKNGLGIRISLAEMENNYQGLCARPERLWMGWGDWTVVAAVRADRLAAVRARLLAMNTPNTVIGEFVSGRAEVILQSRSSSLPLSRLESERFAQDSWFTKGVAEYRRLLHELPMP